MHTHNVLFGDFQRDYRFAQDYRPVELLPRQLRATFQGIVREDGRVATRNVVGIFVTVNCSTTVARKIAEHFTAERLARLARTWTPSSPASTTRAAGWR